MAWAGALLLAGCRTPEAPGGVKDAGAAATGAAEAGPGAAASPPAAGPCEAVLDAATEHKIELRVAAQRLLIIETSAAGDHAPLELTLTPSAARAPGGAPKYACGGIAVWDAFARIGANGYALAEAPADAGETRCSSGALDVRAGGGRLVVAQSGVPTRRYALTPRGAAAEGEPDASCRQGATSVAIWGLTARIDDANFALSELPPDRAAAALEAVSCVRFAEEEHTVGALEPTGNYIVLLKDGVKAEACVSALKSAAPDLTILDSSGGMVLVRPAMINP